MLTLATRLGFGFMGLLVMQALLFSDAVAQGALRNLNANHCEFYVDSLRTRLSGHYGYDKEVATAVLLVHPDVEFGPWYRELRAVGNWLSFEENGELKTEETLVALTESYDALTNYQFRSDFLVRDTYYDHSTGQVVKVRRKVLAFNYFIEVIDQDGGLLRLWLNHDGYNFGWQESFASAERQVIPYGYVLRADGGASLFHAKASCATSVDEARRLF